MVFLAEFICTMNAAALFIDGKLDRLLANRRAKSQCFLMVGVQDGEAAASGKGSNFRPVWARNGIFRAPISSRIAPKSNSLIRRIISLITCSNSLQAPTNFPVRMRRELAGKALIGTPVLGHLGRRLAQIGEKSAVNSLLAGNLASETESHTKRIRVCAPLTGAQARLKERV